MGKDEILGEVVVLFVKGTQRTGTPMWVLAYDNDIFWDTRFRQLPANGRWSYINLDYSTPAQEVNEYETYDFSELDGNWSSHLGGDGLWALG